MSRIKQSATIFLCLASLAGQARALNLTPLEVVTTVEGPPQHRYYFQDADKRLGFRIDPKTTVNGSADAATFRFTDSEPASARLLKSPAPPNVPFTGDGPKTYEALARTLLLSGVSKVQLIESKPDAITINGWTSLQFVFTYEWVGYSYTRTVTFLNFNATEQFVWDVNSRTENYERVYARSYRILNSIFELPLTHETGPS
ncbi:MAG: hypothetical protein H0X40_07410 [Chthoniobacterales bacterium]|nr:hypothetical protein [Chthoniobacterales bacterium]